jgi:hypothetical protein
MNDENRFLHPNAVSEPDLKGGWRGSFTTRRVLVIVAVLLVLVLLGWLLTPKATRNPTGGRFAATGPMPVVVA